MAGSSLPCPRCGKVLGIPAQRAPGQRLKCPHCKQEFVLQAAGDKQEPIRHRADPSPPTAPRGIEPASIFNPDEESTPLTERIGRRRPRRSARVALFGSLSLGIVVAAIFFWFDRTVIRHRPSAQGTARTTRPTSKSTADDQQPSSLPLPHLRAPIVPLLVPDGAHVLIHMRPTAFWRAPSPTQSHDTKVAQVDRSAVISGRGEELRRCVAPLSAWAESQLASWSLFPPDQIDEILFSIVLRTPGEPVDVAATVWLKSPAGVSEISKRFDGTREAGSPSTLPIYTKEERALVIRDDKTFAVGPRAAAQEMADANTRPNPTDPSIEELLVQTDRSRDLTLIFRPDDLDRFRESLFPAPLRDVVHRVALWLEPESIEGAVISLHFGAPFSIRLDLRNRTATNATRLQNDFRARIDRLPIEFLQQVRHLRPATSGHRKLIGRVPAMWKAVSLGTTASSQPRLMTFESILPERAAPNLSLGTSLLFSEMEAAPDAAATIDINKKGEPRGSAKPSQSVSQRLQNKIDIDFRRTPLSEAFASIGEEIGVTFEIDGGALKNAGYTKNMPQTFRLAGAPAVDAVHKILKAYDKLVVVIDESRNTIVVTTREGAKAKRQKPFELK
jgi:hypothetical protein